jgi:hypothetical protein
VTVSGIRRALLAAVVAVVGGDMMDTSTKERNGIGMNEMECLK